MGLRLLGNCVESFEILRVQARHQDWKQIRDAKGQVIDLREELFDEQSGQFSILLDAVIKSSVEKFLDLREYFRVDSV